MIARHHLLSPVLVILLILLTGCGGKTPTPSPTATSTPGKDSVNTAQSLTLDTPKAKDTPQPTKASASPAVNVANLPKPESKIIKLDDLSIEDWRSLIENATTVPAQTMMGNTIYVVMNQNGIFPFWKSGKNIVTLNFTPGQDISENPHLLQYLKEYPSDLKLNELVLLDLAPLPEKEKAEFQIRYVKMKEVFPYVITDRIGDYIFSVVKLGEEDGKYLVSYIKGENKYQMTVYDIVRYKNGRYDDLDPADIFGTDEIKISGLRVFQDEASIYWRNENHIFDFPAKSTDLEILRPLIETYIKKFPAGLF